MERITQHYWLKHPNWKVGTHIFGITITMVWFKPVSTINAGCYCIWWWLIVLIWMVSEALYMCWILEELDLIQKDPTLICVNNHGAIHMANAQKPTHRICHVEMKHFVIIQWTDDEFINFFKTKTQNQATVSLSKPTDCTKFYEHMDVHMGQSKPKFTGEPTTIVHYIQHQGVDVKPSPYLNPLYDFTQTNHEFTRNSYGKILWSLYIYILDISLYIYIYIYLNNNNDKLSGYLRTMDFIAYKNTSPVERSIQDHSTVGRCESISTMTPNSDPVMYEIP